MTRSVILVHGIWTDGHGSIFRLAPLLEAAGLSVKCFQYPHSGLLDTFSKRKSDENARLLCQQSSPGDDVIFHSNGCRVVHRAMQLGAEFRQAYAFAPAFGAKTPWPALGCKKLNVVHNVSDWALWRGGLIPKHDFGHLGVYGYLGKHDPRVHSISNHVADSVDRHNHSHMWQDDVRLAKWADYLIARLSA